MGSTGTAAAPGPAGDAVRPGQRTGGPGGPGRGVNVKTPPSEQVAGGQGLTMLRCLSKAPPGVDALGGC